MEWSNEEIGVDGDEKTKQSKGREEQNNFNKGDAYGSGLEQGLCIVQSAAIVHIRIEVKSASIAALRRKS